MRSTETLHAGERQAFDGEIQRAVNSGNVDGARGIDDVIAGHVVVTRGSVDVAGVIHIGNAGFTIGRRGIVVVTRGKAFGLPSGDGGIPIPSDY